MFSLTTMVIAMALAGNGLTVDPFQKIEAENYDYVYYANVMSCTDSNTDYMSNMFSPTVIGYYGVDFGTGAQMIQLRLATWDYGFIYLHLDSPTNEPIVSIPIQPIGGYWDQCKFFILQQFVTTVPIGVHNLYFTFDLNPAANNFANIDWFTFLATS